MRGNQLVFRILGPVAVEGPDGELATGGPRARAVLVALLLGRDHWIGTDALVDAVFGDAIPPAARNSLQSHVSRLRKVLRPHGVALDARGDSYRLSLGPSALDLDRFRDGATLGVRTLAGGDPPAAGQSLRAALAWWRGPALGDLANHPRMGAIAAGLDEERRRATEVWFDAELTAGHHAGILAEMRDAATRYPYQERLHGQLMIALYRSGRQADALDVLRRLEATMAEDVGLSPGPELREIERRILTHDTSLVAGPGSGSTPALTGGPAPSSGTRVRPAPNGVVPSTDRPGRPPAPALLPFVGRHDELERLAQLARSTRDGVPTVAVIEGEAGMGKSRLVAEAVEHTPVGAGPVLAGGCSPDLGIPYEPFTDILGDFDEGVPSPGPTDPGLARYRLLTRLREVLSAALRPAGGTLVIEDLHWATPPTVAAVRFLTLKQPLPGCLTVVTLRPPEVPRPAELTALLADLRRAGPVEWLTLEPLTDGDMAELLAQRGPRGQRGPRVGPARRDDDEVRTLHRQTGGLPLLVDIALSDHRARGRQARPGETGQTGEPPPPTSLTPPAVGGPAVVEAVRAFVSERMARLDPAARTTLARCAVLGAVIDVAVLDAVGAGDTVHIAGSIDAPGAPPPGQRIEALERLRQAGLLREVSTDRFAFAHELTRAAVLAGVGPSRTARLHEEAAAAIEAVHGVHAGTVDRLATHLLAAARPGTEVAAAAAALRAAQLAVDRAALHDAQRWARAGLELLPPSGVPAGLEADLALALAHASYGLGEHEARRAAAARASRAARALGDPHRLARAAVIHAAFWAQGGSDPESVELLLDAREQLGEADPALRSRLLAALAGLHTVTGMDAPPGVAPPPELADEAVRLGSLALACEVAAGDGPSPPGTRPLSGRTTAAESLAFALSAQIVTRYGGPFAGEQVRAADEIAALGRRYDDRYLSATAARYGATPRLLLGDRAGFETAREAVTAFAADVDFREYGAPAEQWLALLALLDGRLGDVEGPSRRAVDVSGGHPNLANAHQMQMLWLARERDQLHGSLDRWAALADATPHVPALHCLVALGAVDTDHLELARAQLDRLAPRRFAAIPRDAVWLGGIALLIEVAVATGDRDRLVTLAGLLAPYAGQVVVVGFGTLCLGAVDRFLALAAAALGDALSADRRFRAALDRERDIASPPLQGWTELWWGRVSRSHDPVAAKARLARAAATADAYGGALLARQAAHALHDL